MDTALRILTVVALLSTSSLAARGETPFIETEVTERILDEARIETKAENLKIQVHEHTYEFEAIPDKNSMREVLGLNIPDKVREQILLKGGSITEVDPMEPFESLTPEKQKNFLEMRSQFLATAARILNASRFVFGVGSLIGDSFSFIKVKIKSTMGTPPPATESVTQRTFQVRSQQAVQAMLKGLDYKLWSQAPLVIDSNEFSLSVSAGVLAEAGVLRRGGGGADELGFSLGFNKSKKAFVFEIFHNSERFDHTKAAIAVIGVVGKAGFTMGRREGAETLRGHSFYPPAIPGYSTSSSEFFSSGLSSSLGLPPPPLADLLTFTNTFDRQALIRITVSPVMKGFIRIQIGDVRGSVKLVAMRFVDVYNAIAHRLHFNGRRSCQVVFQ